MGTLTSQTVERKSKRDLLGPEVGQRIREVRMSRGMSLAEVGGEDLTRSFLSLVEHGRSRISLRALAIVADRMDLPMATFLEDEDERRTAELAVDQAEIELERDNPKACLQAMEGIGNAYTNNARAQWLRGRALGRLGEAARATEALRRALELAETENDAALSAEVLYSLGNRLYSAGSYEKAVFCFERGLSLAVDAPAPAALQAHLNMGIGHVLHAQSRGDEALVRYDRARELFESLYDLAGIGSVFSAMSMASRKKGNLDAALGYSKQSVAAFRLRRDWRQVARELNNMAVRHGDAGDLQAGAARAKEAVDRAREAGAGDIEAYARGTLASIYLRLDRPDEAEREARAAELLASDKTPLVRVDAWVVQGRIAAIRGEADRADALYKRALASLQVLGHQTRFGETALEYSLLLRERGDLEAALDIALQAAGTGNKRGGNGSVQANTMAG